MSLGEKIKERRKQAGLSQEQLAEKLNVSRQAITKWETEVSMSYSEKYVEQKLVTKAKKMGGLAVKFVSPGLDGVPDRLILFPGGKVAFAELKAPGKKLRPLQEKRKRTLEALGFRVYVIDNVEQIGGILHEIQTT